MERDGWKEEEEEMAGEGRRGEEIGGEEESENYRISQKLVLWRTIK